MTDVFHASSITAGFGICEVTDAERKTGDASGGESSSGVAATTLVQNKSLIHNIDIPAVSWGYQAMTSIHKQTCAPMC